MYLENIHYLVEKLCFLRISLNSKYTAKGSNTVIISWRWISSGACLYVYLALILNTMYCLFLVLEPNFYGRESHRVPKQLTPSWDRSGKWVSTCGSGTFLPSTPLSTMSGHPLSRTLWGLSMVKDNYKCQQPPQQYFVTAAVWKMSWFQRYYSYQIW